MACRGICERLKARKPSDASLSRYLSGQKRCQTCTIFLVWGDPFCPCCGSRLRSRPRNSGNRRALRSAESSQNHLMEKLMVVMSWPIEDYNLNIQFSPFRTRPALQNSIFLWVPYVPLPSAQAYIPSNTLHHLENQSFPAFLWTAYQLLQNLIWRGKSRRFLGGWQIRSHYCLPRSQFFFFVPPRLFTNIGAFKDQLAIYRYLVKISTTSGT